MNSLLRKALTVFFTVVTSTSFAGRIDDGGMSGGGGGGTLPGSPITETQVADILLQARLEVYMVLALESQGTTFPWPELFVSNPTIFETIRGKRIFTPLRECRDADGNSVDGSIHSPVSGTICISTRNLASKLKTDNARAQVLALIAHEYSHLHGFDEKKAQALQKWFAPVFANSSSGQAFNLLDFMMRQVMDLSDYLHEYKTRPAAEINWDYLCFVNEKVTTALTIIEQQFIDKPFSIFHRALYTKQNSYLVKQIVLTTQVCARSQFHPQKEFYKKDVSTWFKDSDTIYDRDLSNELLRSAQYDIRNNILVLGDLPIRKISTFGEFDTEFADVQKYIYDDLRFHINRLWDLVETKRR